MSSDINRKKLISDLIGIGIFMSGERPSFKLAPKTPEQVLVQSMKVCREDRLILQLIHTWIMEYSDILHVESLQKFSKNIPEVEKAILASLLSYTEDRKFDVILKTAHLKRRDDNYGIHKMMSFAAQIGQVPFDTKFLNFGLSISQLSLEPNKKMIPFEYVLETNPFMKCRYIFGANWRADIAALMTLEEYNPTQVVKILGCSYETAHRNMKDLKKSGWPHLSWNSNQKDAEL